MTRSGSARRAQVEGLRPNCAVIDIGSNTVRLVVYRGSQRVPDIWLNEKVAARLRFSNRARKRLACMVAREQAEPPTALAYWVGTECAVDRLLLAGRPADARALAGWTPPRMPIGGSALMARGIPEGPQIARTLGVIERLWVEQGFPTGETFKRLVEQALVGR